jgi:electron transport complex protein RnfC
MKPVEFTGGIHPPANKLTAALVIEEAPVPERVILPLAQHIGAPAEAMVKVGDLVKEGQLIARNEKAFVSAPIHASIAGKVVEIAPYPHPLGHNLPAIVIQSEKEPSNPVWAPPSVDPFTQEPATLKNSIRDAGIVGMGGATFPTHVKLSPPKEKPIDTLIINGAECEPFLTADHRLMLEHSGQIIEGIRLLMHILGVERAYIGIEKNKPDAIEKLNEAADGTKIKVIGLKVKYPQGSEKHLIKALLNRAVPPPPGLPMDVGVVVQNVGTVLAVYEALCLGKPLIERVLTVTGAGIINPKNLRVRIGTPASEVIAFCGGLKDDAAKLILGGPMMGLAQYTSRVPVIKGTSGILVLTESEMSLEPYRDCIRCGKCVNICPMLLLPNQIGIYAEKGMFDEAEATGAMDCLECGCCVYVCPSKRPMVQLIKHAKAAIMARRRATKPKAA